ncbi:MAG: glycerophosphodiester phosphodiesterase [Chloroflexota bacterium]
MATHPFLDHPGPIAFAHRGGAGVHPENTMAAFASAISLGYQYLETDVHVTADDVLIAFHDDRLDRVTDHRGRIAELTWAEIRTARVGGSEPIMRFEELLAAFPTARLNVEPKHHAAVEPLIRLVRSTGSLDRICIGSFSDRRLAAVRAGLGPEACTSLGSAEVAGLRAAAWGLGAFKRLLRRRPGLCAQLPVTHRGVRLVDRPMIRTAHDLGLAVHVWTVNEADQMHRLLDLGVDGLMTDRPALLREVLEARGQWFASANG